MSWLRVVLCLVLLVWILWFGVLVCGVWLVGVGCACRVRAGSGCVWVRLLGFVYWCVVDFAPLGFVGFLMFVCVVVGLLNGWIWRRLFDLRGLGFGGLVLGCGFDLLGLS